MTSPSNPSNPSNPSTEAAVVAAVDRLTGEITRLRDDLQPLRAVPIRLDHLERSVSAASTAAAARAAVVERGLDELAGTVRSALAEMAAAVDGSLTALADSLRNRPAASGRGAGSAVSATSGASGTSVLEATERIVGREIGELRDDLADALEEVLGQVSAQLTSTSEELRSALAGLVGRADQSGRSPSAEPESPAAVGARPASERVVAASPGGNAWSTGAGEPGSAGDAGEGESSFRPRARSRGPGSS